MTRITPFRLIILHLLQIFFTDGRTFITKTHPKTPTFIYSNSLILLLISKFTKPRINFAVGQPNTKGAGCPENQALFLLA